MDDVSSFLSSLDEYEVCNECGKHKYLCARDDWEFCDCEGEGVGAQ